MATVLINPAKLNQCSIITLYLDAWFQIWPFKIYIPSIYMMIVWLKCSLPSHTRTKIRHKKQKINKFLYVCVQLWFKCPQTAIEKQYTSVWEEKLFILAHNSRIIRSGLKKQKLTSILKKADNFGSKLKVPYSYGQFLANSVQNLKQSLTQFI